MCVCMYVYVCVCVCVCVQYWDQMSWFSNCCIAKWTTSWHTQKLTLVTIVNSTDLQQNQLTNYGPSVHECVYVCLCVHAWGWVCVCEPNTKDIDQIHNHAMYQRLRLLSTWIWIHAGLSNSPTLGHSGHLDLELSGLDLHLRTWIASSGTESGPNSQVWIWIMT